MGIKDPGKGAVTYRMIAEALFDNYESIYDIDIKTNAYRTYFQSDSYQKLELSREGEDFFKALPKGISRTIAPEDRVYVYQMLDKETLVAGLKKEKYYRLVYRIMHGGTKVYHQLRATFCKTDDGMHILMGIKNIDDLIRRQIEHENQVTAMKQKEGNYLEAVLASAAAYIEANLTKNRVFDEKAGHKEEVNRQIRDMPSVYEVSSYDDMQRWISENLVAENKEKYIKISDRDYLTDCYARGDKRASVSFSVYTKDGGIRPCKAVFFLYEENVTHDLHVLCVIYDLTEKQRKEKELRDMEKELEISRIRSSTSQMKPHFLYNALGSVQELILIDPQYASDVLGDFMIHMRSCVRALSSDDPIPFSEELKNIKAYTNIEKMRLGDRLEVKYEIKEKDFLVLPLSIQPIVENAIRHGVHMRGKSGGCVMIRTGSDEDAWIVKVEDTGVGFDVEKVREEVVRGKRDSTGIDNIRFRLEKVMGAEMDIYSKRDVGTTVTLRLPKEIHKSESHSSR